ncbi:MAG: AAA family ATPase [Gammaproteobacteria bacterium]|nr:AAA family ATPase [Gammaproteobacteria bacterium]
MSTVSMLSMKGGSGKTTLALSLAVAHELAGGSSAIVDLDPQGSSALWGDLRGGSVPAVIATHPPRLARVLEFAESAGTELVVIDTAPRAGGAVEAARLSDLVLIPCRPSPADLAAVPAAIDVARVADARAIVVLNAVPPRGKLVAEAAEALEAMGAELCPVMLGTRVAHVRSFTAGQSAQELEPRSRAAAEIDALHTWALGVYGP